MGDKEKLPKDLKICAIGDSYHHDIQGAYQHGYYSAFISDGVHSRDLNIKETSGEIPSEDKLIDFLQGFSFGQLMLYADSSGKQVLYLDRERWKSLLFYSF